MKKSLVLLFCSLSFLCAAQTPPDDAQILRDINDSESVFYYPSLLKRYMKADETLTAEDYQHLYYGYAQEPQYEPLKAVNDNGLLAEFASNKNPEKQDYEKVILFLESSIKVDPFNLAYINMLAHAYRMVGDTDKETANSRRLTMLMNTIMSSGTGKKEKSAWQIISPFHAEDVLNYLDLAHKSPIPISIYCQYYPLFEKHNKIKGYYFDFRRIYLKVPEDAGRQFSPGSRGFEINGTPIKKK